jgi:hypothetical protein
MTFNIDLTGPPYPRYAPGNSPGGNGIGEFIIGESPIGDIPSFDPWLPILSQFKNSPTIDAMIMAFNAAMDQTANLESLYDLIWNVATAQGYGLDVWGRIVGVTRTIQFPNTSQLPFGFEEPDSWVGFGQGIFFTGNVINSNFQLNDSDFRTLIFAKAAGNISDGSIPSANNILLTLFSHRGDCFIQDNQNMSITYVFKFALNPVELAIVELSGVLPVRAGVSISVQSFT